MLPYRGVHNEIQTQEFLPDGLTFTNTLTILEA